MNLKIGIAIKFLVLIFTFTSQAERVSNGGFFGRFFSGGPNTSAHSQAPMSVAQITCTLKKMDVVSPQAETMAQANFEALKSMELPNDQFNKCSLLQYLAQITAESAKGKALIELGPRPPYKRGYGYIQVTGPANLAAVSKCMNEVNPPSGNGVSSQPAQTVGQDPNKAALASLCWWRDNMARNNRHRPIATDCSIDSAVKVHQIVNTGSVGGKVTNGFEEEVKRRKLFSQALEGERQCHGA